jgi:hypothetical protein
MLLKKLINKSAYGTIGYIGSKKDLEILESYILYNLGVLKEYNQIIVATNYGSPFQEENTNLWKKYFPNCTLLHSDLNRGHNHGYADLDNLIVDYCKENSIEWLCKSANDIILTTEILDKEIKEADFYYLNGIGYGGMVKYNFDLNRIIEEDFYPQTNFYFINVSKIDYLNNKKFLNETYNQIQTTPNYNGRIWEYIPGWSCEDFLKNCVERNNLSKYHLISPKKYTILLNHIKSQIIQDPSHKNIMIEGICHYHYIYPQIVQI